MTEFKSLAFFFVGLMMILGVVGTIETTVALEFTKILQLALLTLVGFGLMILGLSYANEPVDRT